MYWLSGWLAELAACCAGLCLHLPSLGVRVMSLLLPLLLHDAKEHGLACTGHDDGMPSCPL